MKTWNTILLSRIKAEPWAITETALNTILEIAARENEQPEAIAAKLGRQLQNSYNASEREGVAIIPVTGPLFRYANMFTAVSGASSYELIARDFASAVNNPNIKAIILDIDSPGGEVNGVSELSNMIFEARGKKPILAYASGDAASGAYWIASAADEIVTSETSGLGSIGVVGIYQSKQNKDSTKSVEIVSSQSPNKRLDPLSEEGKAKLQNRIDAMAEIFISTIARNRNVSPSHVIQHYGAGDVFIGNNAIKAGLADRISSLEKLITEFSLTPQTSPLNEGFFSGEDFKPTNKETPNMDIETIKEEHPEIAKTLQDEGSRAEKLRLRNIISSEEASGREKLAREIALSTDLSPEQALALLANSPKEEIKASANEFQEIMASIKNPQIIPAQSEQEDNIEAIAERIAATR